MRTVYGSLVTGTIGMAVQRKTERVVGRLILLVPNLRDVTEKKITNNQVVENYGI